MRDVIVVQHQQQNHHQHHHQSSSLKTSIKTSQPVTVGMNSIPTINSPVAVTIPTVTTSLSQQSDGIPNPMDQPTTFTTFNNNTEDNTNLSSSSSSSSASQQYIIVSGIVITMFIIFL